MKPSGFLVLPAFALGAIAGGVAVGLIRTPRLETGPGSEQSDRPGTPPRETSRDPEARAARPSDPVKPLDAETRTPGGAPLAQRTPAVPEVERAKPLEDSDVPLGPLFPCTEQEARKYHLNGSVEWLLDRSGAIVARDKEAFLEKVRKQRLTELQAIVGEDQWGGVEHQMDDIVRRHAEGRFEKLVEHVAAIRSFRGEEAEREAAWSVWGKTIQRLIELRQQEAGELYEQARRLPTYRRKDEFMSGRGSWPFGVGGSLVRMDN